MPAICCERAIAKKVYCLWLDEYAQQKFNEATSQEELQRAIDYMKLAVSDYNIAQDHLDACTAALGKEVLSY